MIKWSKKVCDINKRRPCTSDYFESCKNNSYEIIVYRDDDFKYSACVFIICVPKILIKSQYDLDYF